MKRSGWLVAVWAAGLVLSYGCGGNSDNENAVYNDAGIRIEPADDVRPGYDTDGDGTIDVDADGFPNTDGGDGSIIGIWVNDKDSEQEWTFTSDHTYSLGDGIGGSYSTSGNKLMLRWDGDMNGETMTFDYAVSGNTLTIMWGETLTFHRTWDD